jgi:predicted dehydrogenase
LRRLKSEFRPNDAFSYNGLRNLKAAAPRRSFLGLYLRLNSLYEGAVIKNEDQMTKTLRAAVAGAGIFGGYHANKYMSLDHVDLVGIFDLDMARAKLLADTHAVKAYDADGLDQLLAEIDVLTIATPAFAHAEVALKALGEGVHVYCEKPIAVVTAQAQAMVAAAKANDRVLAIGHQERAVFEAMGLYGIPEVPLRLEAVRNGTPSTRNLDVSVTLDLMIHDLDLALGLARSVPSTVNALPKFNTSEGHKANGADEITADVTFDNGMTAHFTASRMAQQRERTMRLVYPQGEVFIDLLNRRFENTTPFALNPDFQLTEIAKDPLGTSVTRFLDTVRGVRPNPLCSGEEGLLALMLALKIDGI